MRCARSCGTDSRPPRSFKPVRAERPRLTTPSAGVIASTVAASAAPGPGLACRLWSALSSRRPAAHLWRRAMNQLRIPEKDLPLRDDIRLLGRVLGDTVRDQAGAAVFETIEDIRRTAIRFHRDEDQGARRELEARLHALSARATIDVIRAFSYFSHLANIAEDQ